MSAIKKIVVMSKRIVMRQGMVAGNWKMHGSEASIRTLVTQVATGLFEDSAMECVVLAPFCYLYLLKLQALEWLHWGAQNLCRYPDGAFTGEVSASMLRDCGCEYVIVGHSERRHFFAESNEDVAQKVQMAIQHALKPIICVGESLIQRQSEYTVAVIREQLQSVLNLVKSPSDFKDCVIAYEPVWAIGTGVTPDPDEIQAVHAEIRRILTNNLPEAADNVRILYGGSVKPSNAEELMACEDVDGFLVGGASLQAHIFLEIVGKCNKLF
mgnify:CR=1 FL=1